MTEVPIRAHYSKQRWSDDQEALRRWQRGLTGYPMVDVSLDYDDGCDDAADDGGDVMLLLMVVMMLMVMVMMLMVVMMVSG